MPRSTDQMLARYVGEIEERQTFIDGLVEAAENEQRDLKDEEMELVTRARDRIEIVNRNMKPLEEARKISGESQERVAELARFMSSRDEKPTSMEYRSAGAYVLDRWRAGLGADDANHRLDLYHRAAAHQTTADNPGLLPDQIMGPIVNFVDFSRPVVSAFGARQLPSGSWSRPKVTQHTNVAAQAGEKTELISRKMTIAKLPVTAVTYGGYVNVSRQDIDWTQPQIMDLIINDLAGMYAQVTEDAAGDALLAAAAVGTPIPTGAATAAGISTAIWTAAGTIFAATKGQGRLVMAASADMFGLLGPVFPPINPQNSQSSGFSASDYASGSVGNLSGIQVVLGPQLSAGTLIVASTAAFEIYEDRVGALQVVEPSVLGVQVAYAGYFAPLVVGDTGGIVKIAKTP